MVKKEPLRLRTVLARTAIEKLKLGHTIVSIAATLFPSIASKNSKWKVDLSRWLLKWSHFNGVATKPSISGRDYNNCNATTYSISMHIRIAIDKLKLGHAIVSIAATLFLSIASKNSK